MTLSVRLQHRLGGFALDVAFAAPRGITVLFGRSGSGKTSVVNTVAGLLRPDAGRITVGDRVLLDSALRLSVPVHRRRIGYIFQDARLFPHLTVRTNLRYGAWLAPRMARRADMGHVVDMLGIGTLLDRRPAALSGGERQRVAIGRALLSAPDLILADEPLAALDDPRKDEILPYFERLRDELDVPILYVSHAAAEVARLATTVVALEHGRVIRQGDAADVLGDPTVLPMGAGQAGALLQARIVAHHDDGLTELDAAGTPLWVPGRSGTPGATVRLRVAAQDVILSRTRPVGLSALNVLGGVVATVTPGTGPDVLVAIDTQAGRILSRVTRRSAAALALAPGVAVHAIVKSVAAVPGGPDGAG